MAQGQTLTLTAFGGQPNAPVLLWLNEVNGVPFNLLLLVAHLDQDSRFTLSAVPPPEVFPSTMKLSTLTLRCGKPWFSNQVTVVFQ